ncbi:MAG: hypothetical protein LBB61_03270 [Treponema sp.]|nr:hypothetical protein [Treponema sp.]
MYILVKNAAGMPFKADVTLLTTARTLLVIKRSLPARVRVPFIIVKTPRNLRSSYVCTGIGIKNIVAKTRT